MYRDTREVYCEACGYNLRDQYSGDCPECGNAYDRGKGTGYRDTPFDPIGQWLLRNGRLFGAVFYITLFTVFAVLYAISRERQHLFWAIAMAALGFGDMLLYFLRSHKQKG
ncbi:hypothetical protein OT109_07550 [Phycisphaeraceae bacterium D3-23]